MDGLHLIADCHGCACSGDLLRDAEGLRLIAVRETLAADLTIVGEKFHAFQAADGSAAGVTCALLLAESHVAIHTWPERQAVTLDIYVCNYSTDNTDKAHRLFDALVAAFQPESLQKHVVHRLADPIKRA